MLLEHLLNLLENLKSLPGKNKGYVDYARIGGHHIHVLHTHLGNGRYSHSLQINGQYTPIKDQFDPSNGVSLPTHYKIMAYVGNSLDDFKRRVNPVKMTATIKDQKKKEVYSKWGERKKAKVSGNTRISLNFPENKETHVPSGVVKRNTKDPAFQFTRTSGSVNKAIGAGVFLATLVK